MIPTDDISLQRPLLQPSKDEQIVRLKDKLLFWRTVAAITCLGWVVVMIREFSK